MYSTIFLKPLQCQLISKQIAYFFLSLSPPPSALSLQKKKRKKLLYTFKAKKRTVRSRTIYKGMFRKAGVKLEWLFSSLKNRTAERDGSLSKIYKLQSCSLGKRQEMSIFSIAWNRFFSRTPSLDWVFVCAFLNTSGPVCMLFRGSVIFAK